MLRTTISRNRLIAPAALRGFAQGLVHRRSDFRHHVVREGWTLVKRFGAAMVEDIELREVPLLGNAVIEGYVDDYQRLLIAALVRGLECGSFFEIGTNRGRTSWVVARNNPDAAVYTLDVPLGEDRATVRFELGADDETFFRDSSCGEAFHGTPEAERITQLWGDSGTFDFRPYRGAIDFVYIDGAHTYDYVKSDTNSALSMLSSEGTVAWDDYTSNPDVYRCVTELSRSLPVFHLMGTRMALHSRKQFVVRLPRDDFASVPAL